MNTKDILNQAKQFLGGKDFYFDTMYSKRTLSNYSVICYTLDNTPDHIRTTNFLNLIEPQNQAL